VSAEDLKRDGNGSEGAEQKERPTSGPALFAGEAIRQQQSEAGAEGRARAGNESEFRKSDSCFAHNCTSR
jgi:hypothetical protein